MLRYFYILVCIPWCFCYEYFEENQQFRRHRDTNEINRAKYDNNKMVQFDVMSFLKNSYADKKSKEYESTVSEDKSQDERTQSEYYVPPLNENKEKIDESSINLNINRYPIRPMDADTFDPYSQGFGQIAKYEGELLTKHAIQARNVQNKWPVDKDVIQIPKTKCAFKDMKIPFFSHKATHKKQKKKLLCTNCFKNYTSANAKLKPKRSYGHLCPKCIKQLFQKHEKITDKISQIHCSREFYQLAGTTKKRVQNVKRLVEVVNNTINLENSNINPYNGKSYERHNELDRQLNELTGVEKKVDHVRVKTPKFNVIPLI